MWSDSDHYVTCYSEGFIDIMPTYVYFSAGTVFRNSIRITHPSPGRTMIFMSETPVASQGYLTLHVLDKEILHIPNGFRLPSGIGINLYTPTLTITLDLGWSMCLVIDSGTLSSWNAAAVEPRVQGIRTIPCSNTVVYLGISKFTCDILGLSHDGTTYMGSNTLYAPATKVGVFMQNANSLTVGSLVVLPSCNLRVAGTIIYHNFRNDENLPKPETEPQPLSRRPFVQYSKEMAIKGISYSGGQIYILSDKVYFSEGITCTENIEMDEHLGILRFSPSLTSTIKVSAFGTYMTWEKDARLPAGFTLMRGVLDLDLGWAKTIIVSRKLSNPFVTPVHCSMGTAQWKCSHIQLHKDGTLEFGHDTMVEIVHVVSKTLIHYRLGKLQICAPVELGIANTRLQLFQLCKNLPKPECSKDSTTNSMPSICEEVVLDLEDTSETASLLRGHLIKTRPTHDIYHEAHPNHYLKKTA